jgi:hypothetical protein
MLLKTAPPPTAGNLTLQGKKKVGSWGIEVFNNPLKILIR